MDVPSVEAEAEHVRYEFGSDEVRQSGYGWSRSLRQNIGKLSKKRLEDDSTSPRSRTGLFQAPETTAARRDGRGVVAQGS